MVTLWWLLTLVLFLLGLAGTIVPFIPGTLFIFGGAVVHRLAFGGEGSVSWWVVGALGGLMVLSFLFDFLSSTLGAKYFGATRWGLLGGVVGGIVGLFFGLPGIIVGPLLGVLLGELIFARQRWKMAAHSTLGAALGTVAGVAIRGAIALLMLLGWGVAFWLA